MTVPRPSYDPSLEAKLTQGLFDYRMQSNELNGLRAALNQSNTATVAFSGKPITHEDVQVPVAGGEIKLLIARSATRKAVKTPGPGIYFIHGGGFVMGNRFLGMSVVTEWVEKFDATCFSVEYRLAPEHPYPTPLEDCYAGLKWVGSRMSELGIDESRLMIAGQSAGGGLAAALAMRTRDQGGPRLCGQLLMCPMLDSQNMSVSSNQFMSEGTWSGLNNQMAWASYLGDPTKGKEQAPILASPGLAAAADLLDLPDAFIDVGSAEVFRDEDMEYASRLFEAGVQVEFHIWPGGFHGFDLLLPDSELSQKAIQTRTAWVKKMLFDEDRRGQP
ncbi:uncharacterized protein N7511_006884 [Penicillium nucicola]|uniref:uncharacterized protein n=1 Tax=Penicillium nucicola TaxID=1850975 RepID=UPI0025452AE3|nr:uncharacterized protein N7511_006884 [Penicillium nucicola]KAJ5758190.1 hypothetical protein N7511_006884 [Penicillium nucicola]